jgi:hypothetical protein
VFFRLPSLQRGAPTALKSEDAAPAPTLVRYKCSQGPPASEPPIRPNCGAQARAAQTRAKAHAGQGIPTATMEQDAVGAHCSLPDCRQRDFLPWECDCCKQLYCLDHRSYVAHACVASGVKDHRAVLCPLCAQAIHFVEGEDINKQFERHCATDCTPGLRAERVQKKRCPVPGCREKLTASNKSACSKCRVEHCLGHRHADSHSCKGVAGVVSGSFLGRIGSAAASSAAAVAMAVGAAPPSRKPGGGAAASSMSAAERLKQTAAARARPVSRSEGAVAANGPAAGAGSASAPAAAGDVIEILDNAIHVGSGSGSSGAVASRPPATAEPASRPRGSSARDEGGAEICPVCSAHLPSIMALIEHSEAAHATGASAASQRSGSSSLSPSPTHHSAGALGTTFGLPAARPPPEYQRHPPQRPAAAGVAEGWGIDFGPVQPQRAPVAAPPAHTFSDARLGIGPGERCPHCQQAFADVHALIRHCELAHSGSGGAGGGGAVDTGPAAERERSECTLM